MIEWLNGNSGPADSRRRRPGQRQSGCQEAVRDRATRTTPTAAVLAGMEVADGVDRRFGLRIDIGQAHDAVARIVAQKGVAT